MIFITATTPPCIIECNKHGECVVVDPNWCPDKELVQYLNCYGLQIQNLQKKECK